MGGGQLGRMFVHAAQRMGYFTAVLDPDEASPAGRASHHHIRADYLDEAALAALSGQAQAITTEFENVPAAALARLAARRFVAPGAAAVAIAQDRALEKAHFVRCGVPCAPYAVITSEPELAAVADELLPGILKTARLGYDGKGQVRVRPAPSWPPPGSRCGAARSLRAGEDAAARLRVLRGRGARAGRQHRQPAGAAQPAPRRHPGRDRGARRLRAAGPGAAGHRRRACRSRRACPTSASCASSSSCWPMARWSSTKWRPGRTTAATGPLTPPTSRNSNFRCARSLACR